ncbi:pseudoazurin [Helicobacter sp. MIT 11-5569]|uniref:pseudoazurin n=1 Tax=Helicobacter sp. MIT 11-5569 TaxID=1548151 RepID=UPI00051F9C57|nr:pseudoazurin [Helicobacter sp. MIT 11-5569]TLD84428.1 pseudoazurin [Helicobacter sp. MIT 11-5569]
MKKLLALIFALSFCFAKDYEVQMLDLNENGQTMVFEPAFIKIAPGDSVTFVPTHKSHYVRSVAIPESAQKFESLLDKKKTFTFEKEGIYLYVCPPHQMMNMVGIIQVGKPTNLKKVESLLPKLEKRAISNKGRWLEYAKRITE